MNEAENPYASPQADLGATLFVEGMSDDLPGLRTTGIGLSLVYYGIILILLTILGSVFSLPWFPSFGQSSPPSFVVYSMLIGVPLLIGCLLVFAGQIVCLFVPSQTGAKGFIISAVILQIAQVLQPFLPMVQTGFTSLNLPKPVAILLNLLSGISVILFMLFMRKLSMSLGRKELTNKARNVLVFSSILLVVYFIEIYAGLQFSQDKIIIIFSSLGISLLMGGLICFVMFANLINALRKVLLSKHPVAEADEAASV
jgi:hypothetical protein